MDDRIDRLYSLMPEIYRIRDAEQGYPLQALLRVIAEQVNVVEDNISQLYENWFIETAEDWVVPYLGDLVSYRTVHEVGEPHARPAVGSQLRDRILVPRREVANTIRYRRRKGAVALLEMLANDSAGWPARAVEFFQLLGWTQNLNHQHQDRARTIDLRHGSALELIDGPFDTSAHTVDIRPIDSSRGGGLYNIPNIGLFVWRLRTYSVTNAPANCLEDIRSNCYAFSALGNDAPLYTNFQPERELSQIAEEINLPAPIRRRAFQDHMDAYYGEGKSMAIWAQDWANYSPNEPIPASAIQVADLHDWTYKPLANHIAVDPERGRIAFPPNQLPKKHVSVSYYYAFSADMGGGEYSRPLVQPAHVKVYRVGKNEQYLRINDALRAWEGEKPKNAIIELVSSGVFVEQINIVLGADQRLQMRAANRKRPIIRLLDWHTSLPDSLCVELGQGSRFTLDGILVTGRSVTIRGEGMEATAEDDAPDHRKRATELIIRHCTLVPGWNLNSHCEPQRPAEPCLELNNMRGRVCIEHSIVGSIQINLDPVRNDPLALRISDSIVDGTGSDREAIGAPGLPIAHALLTIQRCTIFGTVCVHAIKSAENCIFNDRVYVARRQIGCIRFSYLAKGCRAPRRYNCQPELAEQKIEDEMRAAVSENGRSETKMAELEKAILHARSRERERVRPRFNSVRYGNPTYCQLANNCAIEILRGADDESEMGAFHNLFQPQRAANIRARADEYLPAGMTAGVIYAS